MLQYFVCLLNQPKKTFKFYTFVYRRKGQSEMVVFFYLIFVVNSNNLFTFAYHLTNEKEEDG